MTVSNSLLLWLVDVLDKGNLPTEESLRIKSLVDDLNHAIHRAAFISTVPLSEELAQLLKGMQHGSTYIHGAVVELTPTTTTRGWPPFNATVPCQMDQSFAGKQPLHIENLVAENTAKGMENLKQFAHVSSVDLLQKEQFELPIERPKPGEVENFIAQREAESPNTDEIYNSIDDIRAAFKIEPVENYAIGKLNVRNYTTPVQYEFTPKVDYPVALSGEYTEGPNILWFGHDLEEEELVVVETDKTAYRLSRLEVKDFVLSTLPHYAGRVVNRITRRFEKLSEEFDSPIEVRSLELGADILLVIITCDKTMHSSFTTTRSVFNKYFNQTT